MCQICYCSPSVCMHSLTMEGREGRGMKGEGRGRKGEGRGRGRKGEGRGRGEEGGKGGEGKGRGRGEEGGKGGEGRGRGRGEEGREGRGRGGIADERDWEEEMRKWMWYVGKVRGEVKQRNSLEEREKGLM